MAGAENRRARDLAVLDHDVAPRPPSARSLEPYESSGVVKLWQVYGCLPKFGVIPGECPVEDSQLMIICPYPFCNASCEEWPWPPCRPRAAAIVAEGGGRGGEVPMMSGLAVLAVRCPVQVQMTLEAARCERSA
jgi:hypothetical protein